MQSKTLTGDELAELEQLLLDVDYRLVTSDGQRLAEAGVGEVLTDGPEGNSFRLDLSPELQKMERARKILGFRRPGSDAVIGKE